MQIENPYIVRLLFAEKSPIHDYQCVATENGYEITAWDEAAMGMPLADLPALIESKGQEAIAKAKLAARKAEAIQGLIDSNWRSVNAFDTGIPMSPEWAAKRDEWRKIVQAD